MKVLRHIPQWDEISEVLIEQYGYSKATLKRTKTTYNVFISRYCSDDAGDSLETIRKGIETSEKAYQSGIISRDQLARLRRIGFRTLSYLETGKMIWRRVPLYGQHYGTDEHECLISEFVENEQKIHSHAESIISRDKCILRIFILYAEEHGIEPETITTSEMIDFLKYMRTRRPAGLSSIISALKHFYLFLIDKGTAEARILFALKNWDQPHKKVYGILSSLEMKTLIDSIDTATAIGKRDKAIFLLAMDCGIRSSDICTLKLSEIDWRNSAINIVQEKTQEQVAVPFSIDTGNALADYILHARGETKLPYVFVKDTYVDSPMTASLLCVRLKKHMQEAGINRPASDRIGMHTFRRTLGTELIDSGENMELVAQVLGHKDTEATKVYISTSERMLRLCPLAMPPIENGGMER